MILLIRVLKFRQDHRIKKIFLPFRKKGKKHNPSSREGVQHCANNTVKQGKKHLLLAFRLFFRGSEIVFSRLHPRSLSAAPQANAGRVEGVKKNQVNPVNPVRKRVDFIYK
jgi:hypothetical protein